MADGGGKISPRNRALILFPDSDLCSRVSEPVDICYIFVFHGNAAKRPVLVPVDHKIFMRPGSMNADAATDTGISRYFAPLLSLVEFFITLLCWIIY